MKLDGAHLRHGFALSIQSGPKITEEWIGVFHEQRMNRQPADTSADVCSAQASVLQSHPRRSGRKNRKAEDRSFGCDCADPPIELHNRALEFKELAHRRLLTF